MKVKINLFFALVWMCSVLWSASLMGQADSVVFQLGTMQGHTQLQWEMTSLGDVQAFDLEYSADGMHFERFAQITAQGLVYTYTDPILRLGTVAYYRLQMKHQDGRSSYSMIKAIRLEEPQNTLTLWPNPVKTDLLLRFALPTAERYQLEIRSIHGQVLWSRAEDLPIGIHELTLPLTDLPSGWYSLHVRGGAVQLIRPIVK